MIDAIKLKDMVSKTFPELVIDSFELMGNGKAGMVCLVNNKIVFKVPLQKNSELIRWQKNEVDVLRFLEDKIDIDIPKILYAAATEHGSFIFGETLLSGVSLSYELYDSFDNETKNDILKQLGRIVRRMHDAGGHDSSWQVNGYEETPEDIMEEFYKRFSKKLKTVLTSNEINKIEEIAGQYRILATDNPVKPVLCHQDLHLANLMIDIDNKQVTGMLDFGCAGYCEPARDWHYYFNPQYILEGYGDNGDEYFLERQKFHALSWLLNNLSEEIQGNEAPYKSLGFIRDFIL